MTAGPVPAPAQVDSPDGAVAFVRFAAEEVNRAYQQADPNILDQVFSSECPGCMAIKKDVQSHGDVGRRVLGSTWVNITGIPDSWSPGRATVELALDQTPADIVDSLGRKVSNFKSGHFSFIVTLTRADTWRIVRWQRLES